MITIWSFAAVENLLTQAADTLIYFPKPLPACNRFLPCFETGLSGMQLPWLTTRRERLVNDLWQLI